MSWSVSAGGRIADVKAKLDSQFLSSLADPPAGLADEGERETVRLVSGVIVQCLGTFDPARSVVVSAYGHMSFADYDTKAGACQDVTVSIKPG